MHAHWEPVHKRHLVSYKGFKVLVRDRSLFGHWKIRDLAHASYRDAAEGSQHVGLDTRRRLEHKDATSTKQIHWHL